MANKHAIEPKALHYQRDKGGAPLSELSEEATKAFKTGSASELEPFSEDKEQEEMDEDNELFRARLDRFQKLLPKMGQWTDNCKLVPPFKMVLRTKVL